ncbi:hypothetical protein [Corynebacterium flavescens]|uniref:hypothetical protein n=1 Tax=Corynebacterium flavescens TaxID=28028 RepID=UPI003FD15C25
MKFFSRKALVAGATAIAVSFAGVNVASAQSTTTPAASSTSSAAPTTTPEAPAPTSTPEPGKGGSSDMKASDIKEWIGIITAVVGALSAIYTFINKISK